MHGLKPGSSRAGNVEVQAVADVERPRWATAIASTAILKIAAVGLCTPTNAESTTTSTCAPRSPSVEQIPCDASCASTVPYALRRHPTGIAGLAARVRTVAAPGTGT